MEDDNTKDAYDISKYDLVYILLKGKNELYQKFTRYDMAKKRYFIEGIVVQLPKYPVFHSIAFVDEKDIKEYRKAKRLIEKEKFIHNIFFGDIDFITLPFDNFDWKKPLLIR
jgi:hypothetical protein